MIYWSSIKMPKHLVLIFALCVLAQTLVAQTSNISPFSRFGLGDLYDQTHTEQFSMGGLSIPVIDPFALNVANPASYHHVARPLFSVGMRLHLLNLHTETESRSNFNHSINNLAVAFPLAQRKWGLAIGIMPFSTIGYHIETQSEDENIHFEYIGEGGLTRAYIGNSFQLYNRVDTLGNRTTLSAGANVSYIFGNVDRLRKSIYSEGPGYNFRVREALRIDDVSFDIGVNFSTHLRKMTEDDKSYAKLILGATLRVPKTLGAKGSSLAQTYSFNSSNQAELAIDTVRYINYGKAGLNMPLAMGVGVGLDMVTRGYQKILVGVEYRSEMWTEFREPTDNAMPFDELGDSQRFILGVDFQPNSRSSRRILSKIHYRLGGRFEQMSAIVGDQQVEAYGISFGAGIPISLKRPQTPSTFNIGVEMGRRGSTDNNMLREDYLMISIGLTLMPHFRNAWFVQRKYD